MATSAQVEILVDAPAWKPTKIAGGEYKVSDLKALVGVSAEKILARIDPRGLVDLYDDGIIEVKDGMRFMSHTRSGANS